MQLPWNLDVKEAAGLFENIVDWMLYVNLQTPVLQQNLEHSMNIECHLTVKETARMQLEKPADWMLYVHLQAVVLQQKLEHSMKTQCYCCWSQAFHS